MTTKPKSSGYLFLILLVVLVAGSLAYFGRIQYIQKSRAAVAYNSRQVMEKVVVGLKNYQILHGEYPVFDSYPRMVSAQSRLVIESLIPPGMPTTDQLGFPYLGYSKVDSYRLECLGDPKYQGFYPHTIHQSK
jgi:hypothetical protein